MQTYKPLSKQERDVMKKYINKYFEKSFIKFILSVIAAPVLLVRKPDSRLRFCVDYKALNKITIRNQYSIPLINKILKNCQVLHALQKSI